MKNILFYGLLMAFLTACGGNKIAIENSQNVIVEYKHNRPIKYSDTIPVAFYNVNASGERMDISNSLQLKVYGEGVTYIPSQQSLCLDIRPQQKDVNEVSFLTVLKEKEDSVSYPQKLKLSYSEQITVSLKGKSGKKGANKLPRLRPVLLSEGKAGKDGENGENGEDGQLGRVYIWYEGDMCYVRTEVIKDGSFWYYQTTNKYSIVIDASGGDGGDGGNGGDGSRGAKGSVSGDKKIAPGNGGNGGNGGNAGNGGNGVQVEVIVHPNARDIVPNLTINNKGGKPGEVGEYGEPGKGGPPASGQTAGKAGIIGQRGANGFPGMDGPTPVIIVEDFNFQQW